MRFLRLGPTARRLAVTLGIGALVPACRFSVATYPDAGRHAAVFSPDLRTVVVASRDRLLAYDLDAKRVTWERPLSRPMTGFSFSPSGSQILLVEKYPSDPEAIVSLLQASNGKVTFAKSLVHSPRASDNDLYAKVAGARFSASDDGAWILLALDDGSVELYSALDGTRVFRDSVTCAIIAASFQAWSTRLVFTTMAEEAQVVDRVGGTWTTVAKFTRVVHPSWTSIGLTFGSADGLELWDGTSRRLVLDKSKAFYLPDGRTPPPVWRFSSDGVYLASWNLSNVKVYRVSDGAALATAEQPGDGRWPIVQEGSFAGDRFRAFLRSGDFLELALDGSHATRKKAFGEPGSYSRNLFQDGASWDENYAAQLSPDGRFLDLYEESRGHTVLLTK